MSKSVRQAAKRTAFAAPREGTQRPAEEPAADAGRSAPIADAGRSAPIADADRTALITAAQIVRAHAHAPYSRFAVGAAVLDEQGRVHAGCNVENAAYPQGWCAEASALAVMVAAGGKRVQAVAVCAVAPEAVTPCGGCRQKLREFAADDCPIWVADLTGLRASYTLGALLPHGFGPAHLTLPAKP